MSFDLSQRIKRLQNYKGSPSPILSIYFKLPVPKRVTNVTIVNKLQTYINANLSYEQREELRNNIELIIGFMENYQQARGERTLAFFSGGDNFFEVLHLPYEIDTVVKYSHDPYIEPLLKSQSDHRRYLVILNERKRAILYTVLSGTLEDQKTITNDTVPQDVRGNWPDSPRADRHDKVQRHIREHVHHQFLYIAQKAAEFISKKPIAGVILGGHRTEMSQLQKLLPKQLKEKVVGTFVSDLKTDFNEILAKSKDVIARVDKKFNKQSYIFKAA